MMKFNFDLSNTKAAVVLDKSDQIDKVLVKASKLIKKLPLKQVDQLAYVPALVSMLIHYLKKDYTDLPTKTVLTIALAVAYFISPVDIVLDAIPFLGVADDAAVTAVVWSTLQDDIKKYLEWAKENGIDFDI